MWEEFGEADTLVTAGRTRYWYVLLRTICLYVAKALPFKKIPFYLTIHFSGNVFRKITRNVINIWLLAYSS